jgi:hypothetical protein
MANISFPTRRNGSGAFSLAQRDPGRVLRNAGDVTQDSAQPALRVCGGNPPLMAGAWADI